MLLQLSETAEHLGLAPTSPHIGARVDYVEVTGWVEPEPTAGDALDDPIRRITPGAPQVLREL